MKIPIRIYLLLIPLLLSCLLVKSQFYNTGQAPASVKWMQIKTENFQVIYPAGFYKEANRAVNLLEYTYEHCGSEYSKKPKKISVILYNQSVRSNGYVVWAPKRVEWITTPPQETYVQDWLEQLALHEYRHVVQLDNLEQGLTNVLKVVFGQMITGAVSAYLPLWYLEGDAVVSETSYSSTGRGRDPEFNLELRTMEMEKNKRYSYDQSYLGSYKEFVPDHYKYGYHMVSYAKLKYDNKIWSKTIDKVGRRPYLGAPFYFGLKQNGAKSKVNLYHETFDSLSALWKSEFEFDSSVQKQHLNIADPKHFTNYSFVQPTPYGIFAVKTSIDDITRFVFLNETKDVIIHTPGRYAGASVSAGKKYAVWSEYLPDIRWQQKDFSVIKLFEFATGNEKQLTDRSRYFAPSLSPSDNKIACINIDDLNRYSLIILNSFNGETETEIKFQEGVQIFRPVWLNEKTLVYITMSNNSKQIELYSIESKKKKLLFQSGVNNITHLAASDSTVYFSYDFEMARNIYAIHINSKNPYKVTSSNYGADYPFVMDKHLYYSDYTLYGYRPVKSEMDPADWKDFSNIEKYNYAWADSLSGRSEANIQQHPVPIREYDSLKYNRLLNSFYLHSWAPFYFDIEDFISLNSNIYPGITLMSQNKLSTVTSSISYYYADQTHNLKPEITFERFFPVFRFSVLLSSEPELFYDEEIPSPENLSNYYDFNIRCILPLNLTENKYNRYLQPSVSYGYTNKYYVPVSENSYNKGYDYLGVSLYFSNLLKKSPRDINSRFGQSLYYSTHRPLIDKESFSSSQVGVINFYFPGLFSHHSIRLYMSGEYKDDKKYQRSNSLSLPRGYKNNIIYSKMFRGSIDYTLPLFHPDWSIGPLIYFKRFHTSVFYDAARIQELGSDEISTLTSAGITIASEMNFFRFFIPFTPRFTFAYLPEENSTALTFGISIESSF